MSVFEGTIYSSSLSMMTSLTVTIPDNTNGDMPVLFLLHGLSDNHSAWLRRTNVDLYAEQSGIAVVMPEVQRSFYTDMTHGLKYFSYIADELPAICRRMFRFSGKREDNFIAGLSMGGYGALKVALTCPEKFLAAASFSGAVDVEKRFHETMDLMSLDECYAINKGVIQPKDNLFDLSSELSAKGAYLPDIYMTCGLSDFLYEDNKGFRAHLDSLSIPYTYEEWEGSHEWSFWDESVRRAIPCFLKKRSEIYASK